MSEEVTQTAPSTTEGNTTQEATTEIDGQATEQVTTYANGKYNSVTALEEGYTNLQKKLGSFTGAPEAYEMGEGKDINGDHPLFAELQQYGKDNNLSNEGYNALVDVLVNNEMARAEEMKQQADEVFKALGENGHARVQNIDDFLNANAQLNEDQVALVEQAKGLPGGVELLESFINMSKSSAPAPQEVAAPVQNYTQEKLKEMQFAKDEFGNRKMSADPAYRKKVEDYHAQLLAQG